ncbi:helix-turn-helix transcriptional regulator [Clostridium sp. JN-9]|uniref:helix-turn-helix transcriptional regulator n=1 Tax=Clostridium sp. JN-9 TaxID=2507159 RepID=UPI000FFE011D|nr:helix-turn-helix transcriptional regulator [Clostridium sp. JN-9]QAT39779.1 XRE family transcriptional regulator [Clostridium sp. JN-9]
MVKFLTPNQKVRETRKYLKMKQQDLQDENITRGLISMIETSQRTLTKDTAAKIAEKFNKKAKELNLKFEIDSQYLLRSPAEDAELYCLKKLETLNVNDISKEIFQIAAEFKLQNVKAELYNKMADSCFDKKDYNEAFTNYNNALSIYMDINNNEMIPCLYWRIGLCKADAFQYEDALTFFNLSKNYSIMYKDKKIQQFILYDIALCYKKIGKFQNAIDNVDKFLLMSNKNNNLYFYANILKANCYEAIGKYDTAICIYNSLIKDISKAESPILLSIYNNLGLLYIDKNNLKTSLDYFEKAEEIGNAADKPNLCHTLIEKSELFIKSSNYEEAIKTVEKGLKDAEKYSDYEYLLKGNYTLAHIYEDTNDISNLKKVYFKIAGLLKDKNNTNELISIYIKLSIIFLNENDNENAMQCLKLSQTYL